MMRNLFTMHVIFALLLAIFIGLGAAAAGSGDEVVVAKDYPFSTLFTGMVTTGVNHYMVAERALPQNIATMYPAGYLPYKLPAGCVLNYWIEGEIARVSSNGNPQYVGKDQVDSLDAQIKLKDTSVIKRQAVGRYVESDGEMVWQAVDTDVYLYPGARWLDQGYTMDEVEQALAIGRISIILGWALKDFAEFHGRVPNDLAELEEFIGTERCPISWSSIVLCDTPEAALNTVGGLYAGAPDGNSFRIVANMGPDTRDLGIGFDGDEYKQTGDWSMTDL